MNLPIDGRNAPFRQKYLDEETPVLNRWMVFGDYPEGLVGVSDGQQDIFSHLLLSKAMIIVAARNAWVDLVLLMLNRGIHEHS